LILPKNLYGSGGTGPSIVGNKQFYPSSGGSCSTATVAQEVFQQKHHLTQILRLAKTGTTRAAHLLSTLLRVHFLGLAFKLLADPSVMDPSDFSAKSGE